MSTRLLIPGLSCGAFHAPATSGVLVDGRTYFGALYEACSQAERTIAMTGWQLSTNVALIRGEDAKDKPYPARLLDFLRALCEERPELDVYLLEWDASAVFAFEREPLHWVKFLVLGHERIHFQMDRAHPIGASHHQKLCIVDRAVAFLGGMDVCTGRFDDRPHDAHYAGRREGDRRHGPYHDVQAYVTGDAVDTLRDWFEERWRIATGTAFALPEVARRSIEVRPTLDVCAPCMGLVRTRPRFEQPPLAPIKQVFELYVRAIAAAERCIYIENQYLSSEELGHALELRMLRGDGPLQIVFVLPERSAGFKERIAIGIYQQRILEMLAKVAALTGHQLGVYYSVAPGERDVPVFIHAKVLAVDDRFLLVSSANTTNRSMGVDTELGVAWESPEPCASLRDVRVELMREHCGLTPPEADAIVAPIDDLVPRLDDLARDGRRRLRLHRRNIDEKPGRFLRWLLPDKTLFDPDDPRIIEEILPEPQTLLDRYVREPLSLIVHTLRRHWRTGHRKRAAR